jgi:hypothetical protein
MDDQLITSCINIQIISYIVRENSQWEYIFCFDEFPKWRHAGANSHSRPSTFMLTVTRKIANFERQTVHEDQIFELWNVLQKLLE